MRYRDDKQGSKLLFFAIAIIIVYIAFFNFNIPAAYEYTVTSVEGFFNQL
jgi:hypothetical protein